MPPSREAAGQNSGNCKCAAPTWQTPPQPNEKGSDTRHVSLDVTERAQRHFWGHPAPCTRRAPILKEIRAKAKRTTFRRSQLEAAGKRQRQRQKPRQTQTQRPGPKGRTPPGRGPGTAREEGGGGEPLSPPCPVLSLSVSLSNLKGGFLHCVFRCTGVIGTMGRIGRGSVDEIAILFPR